MRQIQKTLFKSHPVQLTVNKRSARRFVDGCELRMDSADLVEKIAMNVPKFRYRPQVERLIKAMPHGYGCPVSFTCTLPQSRKL